MNKQDLERWATGLLARIPTHSKILYPSYLSAQLARKEEVYASPALPSAFDGYKIAYASDIHYGPYLGRDRVLDLVERLIALDADLLLLGGDYGAHTTDAIPFFDLLPPMSFPDGILAAVGNHDLAGTSEEIARLFDAMRAKGVRPLVTESHAIHRGGALLQVCSVDDIRNGAPDYAKAAEHLVPDGFLLFAPHSPDVIPPLRESRAFVPHLTICGHTHGGQVTVFGRSLHSSSRYRDRYLSGWKHEDGMDILISNGVGTSMLPVRWGAKAQYHRITLKRGRTASAHTQSGLGV